MKIQQSISRCPCGKDKCAYPECPMGDPRAKRQRERPEPGIVTFPAVPPVPRRTK